MALLMPLKVATFPPVKNDVPCYYSFFFSCFFDNFHAIFTLTMPDLTDEEYDALDEYYTKIRRNCPAMAKAVFLPNERKKAVRSFLWMTFPPIGFV
jgi:hypothetical protein